MAHGNPELPTDELLNDPTLADCCRRDLLETRKNQEITAALSKVDPSTRNLKLQQNVLVKPGFEGNSDGSDEDSDFGSDCEEDDPELHRLRHERLQQLQAAAQSRAQHQASSSYADVQTLPAEKLLAFVEQHDGPVVCHLYIEGHEPCSTLDEHLSVLAHRYQGTRFVRVNARGGTQLHSLMHGKVWPGLICFRETSIVGRTTMEQLGGGSDVFEEEVSSYLHRLRVLKPSRHMLGTASRQTLDGLGEGREYLDSEDEQDGDAGGHLCETCGRTYPHEHIRSIQRTSAFEDEEEYD